MFSFFRFIYPIRFIRMHTYISAFIIVFISIFGFCTLESTAFADIYTFEKDGVVTITSKRGEQKKKKFSIKTKEKKNENEKLKLQSPSEVHQKRRDFIFFLEEHFVLKLLYKKQLFTMIYLKP
jgi:hypothetical protein